MRDYPRRFPRRRGRACRRWPVVFVLFFLAFSVRWWGRLFFPLPYFDLVAAHARGYGLDPLLVEALIREESSFDPAAVSRRGALGLMQIMPETGLWIAAQLGEELTPARLFTPEENIRYGVWYLGMLWEKFGGGRGQSPGRL
ncbi:MAG: lytic transglycosylase domain-containing protein [Bacillota bacterium]